jgi:hypothetical protein
MLPFAEKNPLQDLRFLASSWPRQCKEALHRKRGPQRCHKLSRRFENYGAFAATTPMSAMLSPFFNEGTAFTWRITPEAGARASRMTLPK